MCVYTNMMLLIVLNVCINVCINGYIIGILSINSYTKMAPRDLPIGDVCVSAAPA